MVGTLLLEVFETPHHYQLHQMMTKWNFTPHITNCTCHVLFTCVGTAPLLYHTHTV